MPQQTDTALSALKDIHLPAPISYWSLAPGWYFLLLIVLIAAGIGAYFGWKHWHRSRAKNQALKKLIQLENAYRESKDVHSTVQEISILLRRVALAYFPRKQVAGLFGKSWIAFLEKTTPEKYFDKKTVELFVTASYQKNSTVNIESLFTFSRHWIETC
ncbi:MAG: DUF4381 domain-containing protein [Proteobacteria bacterium]|nr:DUF4381 domain-containing protein [Pseudomonadota bacterium]